MAVGSGEPIKIAEKVYGSYPPAYDMYTTSNKDHYLQYNAQCYNNYRHTKFSRPPVCRDDELSDSRKLPSAQKQKGTRKPCPDLQLTISPAPIARRSSPIPSKVWATKIEPTPLKSAESAPISCMDDGRYVDNWSVHLSYLSQPDYIAKHFTNERKPVPIYQRASPPYSTSLPMNMKPVDFGVENKLSPYNENIVRPVTAPAFYKRGPKISLVPYKGRKTNPSITQMLVSRFTPVREAHSVNDIREVDMREHPKTTHTKNTTKIASKPRRCSSAPGSADRNRPPTCRPHTVTIPSSIDEYKPIRSNRSKPPTFRPHTVTSSPLAENKWHDVPDDDVEDQNDIDDGSSVADDNAENLCYDDAVVKYGWRAQVPGDPYGLVKLDERPSFAMACEDPIIPPDPPVAVGVNFNTFFMNTIPGRPKSFVVHHEWVSEQLMAKRLKLQQRQPRYQYKKYAFAY